MDFAKLMAYRNAHNPFSSGMGIRVEEIGPGYARASVLIGPEHLNPANTPHGGLYFTLADTACGSAMASGGYLGLTVNAGYNYLRGAKIGDTVTAEAKVVKAGRTFSILETRVTDQDGALLGTATFTYYRTERKVEA